MSFVKAFNDNYIWIIHGNDLAIVIDPGSAIEVQEFLRKNNLQLSAILLTHFHADHNGGVERLLELYPDVSVYGNHDLQMKDDDPLHISCFPSFRVITTPGHVYEHVCYLFDESHLFCGDTLFSLGCGRVFTGDFDAAFTSLNKIKDLDDNILCYPAHEYTLNNLAFCMTLQNDRYTKLYDNIEHKLNKHGNSLPTLLGYEKEYNPFLRAHDKDIQLSIQQKYNLNIDNGFECFKILRELRNKF
ncbi:MAG: hydroxyacylglutathione hydrolase [Burkholderiales bacterium]|nr:hydroxyacylglutathione hydrolase [Burkholderiales bacterium]